jgi:hypothetical protein
LPQQVFEVVSFQVAFGIECCLRSAQVFLRALVLTTERLKAIILSLEAKSWRPYGSHDRI